MSNLHYESPKMKKIPPLMVLSLVLAGCVTTEHTTNSQTFEIPFAAEINHVPFKCGQRYSGVGVTASSMVPTDFRFYVSEIRLLKIDGSSTPLRLSDDGKWQKDDVALLDFEDGTGPCRNGTTAMNTSVRGIAPAGDYVGLALTVGIPFPLNHQDPTLATPPFNTTAMFWTWQGGYKFIKFDALTEGPHAGSKGSTRNTGYSLHLGSTQCSSNSRTQAPSSCRNANQMTVVFSRFDWHKSVVVADIGAVLTQADVDNNTPNTPPGCMSGTDDPECPPVMKALGITHNGQPGLPVQTFLTVR